MRAWQKLTAMVLLVPFLSRAQDTVHSNSGLGNVDSLAKTYSHALTHFLPPKLIERKQLLRLHQQKGYASALLNVLHGDGFLALLSYLRTRLQTEYSLPHDGILVNITAPMSSAEEIRAHDIFPYRTLGIILPQVPNEQTWIALDIDWDFPADPWKKD